ncbi:MAG: type VI secretion system tube protein Hcp [Planctomycetaceae bacterium]|nr:type VI secretion system tube protein Hcp [Planctomycetaceae bacterium]
MSRPKAPRPRPLRLEMLEHRLALASYLKLAGVDGESKDLGHQNEIDVLSWSWVVPPPPAGSSPSVSEIVVTKLVDSTSPVLFKFAAQGKPIPNAVLDLELSSGNKQEPYLRYKLERCVIKSYQLGGSAEDRPLESLSINFEKIKIVYKEQKVGPGKPGSSPQAVVVRTQDPSARGLDLNGDGTADPIFFNYASLVDLNDDGVFTLIATTRGASPVLADLDGDGAPDDINPAGNLSVMADLDGDGEGTPVPVDFDGDGKIDPLFPLDTDSNGLADLLAEVREPTAASPRGRLR